MMDEEENSENRRSSRRVTSSSKSARKSALEELREARLAGRKHRPNLEVKDVYEVVEEAEYHKIVEGRQNDDFVVDDDGGGYVDTGADFEDDDYYDDGEGAEDKPKKKKKDKKEKKGALDSFFSVTTTKTKGDDQKAKLKLDDDEDLQNMLAELGESGPSDLAAAFETPNFEASPPHSEQPMNPFKRKKIESSPASNEIIGRPLKKIRRETFDRNHGRISTPKPPPPSVDQIKENTPSMVSKPEKEEEEYDDYDYGVPMDDEMDCDFLQETKVAMKESAPEEKEKEVKKEVEAEETVVKDVLRKNAPLTLSEEQWDVDQDQGTDEAPLPEMKIGNEEFYTEKVREDKTVKAIRMYWIDAFEDTHKSNGTVYLFGRVKVAGDRWASCCLIAKNIYRQVFFLPRAKKLSDPNQDVLADEVFYEIKNVFEKHFSTKALKCRTAKRKLIKDTSFGASAGVETDLMEVQYESRHGKLPADLNGETFSQVFNTTTTPMERLLMELKFMGPGWIEFTDFAEMTAKQTYCEYEFTVDMERMERKPAVEYIGSSGNSLIPPVRTLAINVLTTLNDKKESEICMISMLYNRNCNLVHPSADVKQWQRKCLITKPVNGTMPFNFKSVLEQRRLEKIISTAPNEKALLTLFLARIAEFEPDVILSHDLSALITLLVSRLEKLKIANWSRISRLKRILNIGKVGHSKAAQWELTAGRLLLDSRLAAMELVKARSYDLTELSAQLLSKQRKEVEDVASCYTSLERLFQLIDVSWLDSLLALQVIVQLNALPLFMQITNIVGGVASRTMMGGRAERNEYLLLHAFHRDTLIAPDKAQFGKKGGAGKTLNETMIEGEQEEETGGKTKGKAQYSGGLVLEPIKGLYETLILLLDFNSLYPSIIQEYNLCFTTVPHKKDGDEVPDVPDPSLKEGVLPREIRKLVECRRDVKSLMRYQKNEAEKRQLDIRQMALKLTANSMYGCLGFQYSRFYAKPIAALVTSKGREILMHSKELVEKIGYTVIYGDTDSIMINTNSLDLAQAKKLGFEIKKQVNKCHRLLELELDGVFKRLLLLKKKKYAALTLNLDTNEEKKELKGLDIVRRDWSQLAKDIGSSVVDRILDANLSRDQLVASINELLKNIRAQLDAGAVPIELFQISKQLTRNPREYADLKSQPHASTAARLNESGKFSFRHGDIIEYVICEDGSTNAATQRAYHRSEIEGSATLKIDHHYYLAQQIHPVVSRLCAPLEEIDAVRIAEALGMDSSNYRRAAAAHAVAAAENEDDAVWTPELAYDTCDPLIITCGADGCGLTAEMRKCLVLEAGDVKPRTIPTSCSSCGNGIPDGKLLNDLRLQLKAYVDRHVTSAFKCDEPMCEYKTNIVSFRWNREGMECPKCSGGILRKEYTCKQLYEQQMFFRSIVDFKKAEAALTDDQRKELQSNKNDYMSVWQTYHQMLEVVDEFLVNNSFNRVDLASIFAPMCRLK